MSDAPMPCQQCGDPMLPAGPAVRARFGIPAEARAWACATCQRVRSVVHRASPDAKLTIAVIGPNGELLAEG